MLLADNTMRHLNHWFLLALVTAIASCTPPPVRLDYSCDGSFRIEEETPNAMGLVTVNPKHNIDPNYQGTAMPTDSVSDRGIIIVSGKVTDVCDDATISYSGPGGWGFSTVNIPRSTLKASAPATTYAGQDGSFKYSIAIECCPATSGRVHDVEVRPGITVLAARVSRKSVTCVDNNTIIVEGQMAGHRMGHVRVTIINDQGRSCVYETVIAREF
jgi:hypothetical protein